MGDIMTRKGSSLKEVIESIENDPHVKKLPPKIRSLLKSQLKSMTTVKFPVVTIKENDWIVAHNPLLDISAQGKTEEEAIKNLKAMTDDYMTDPDTQKPKIKTILNMEIGIKDMPIKLPMSSFQTGDFNER